MIIDCISDLHGNYPELEGGDLLIVAGDLVKNDSEIEHDKFYFWIKSQKYSKKIVIAGNHDNYEFNCSKVLAKGLKPWGIQGCEYLCDSGTEFEGLKVWGSPWTKTFPGMNPHCKAFTVDTEEELAEKWALIPDDIDILITHSPPYWILDKTIYGENVGSKSLSKELTRIRPMLHIFGHIHEGYGKDTEDYEVFCGEREIILVNASHTNERYEPVNKPVRIEL